MIHETVCGNKERTKNKVKKHYINDTTGYH